MFGGGLAGLGGGYLSVVYARMWIEGMTAGRGWIAVALVIFVFGIPPAQLLEHICSEGRSTAAEDAGNGLKYFSISPAYAAISDDNYRPDYCFHQGRGRAYSWARLALSIPFRREDEVDVIKSSN